MNLWKIMFDGHIKTIVWEKLHPLVHIYAKCNLLQWCRQDVKESSMLFGTRFQEGVSLSKRLRKQLEYDGDDHLERKEGVRVIFFTCSEERIYIVKSEWNQKINMHRSHKLWFPAGVTDFNSSLSWTSII